MRGGWKAEWKKKGGGEKGRGGLSLRRTADQFLSSFPPLTTIFTLPWLKSREERYLLNEDGRLEWGKMLRRIRFGRTKKWSAAKRRLTILFGWGVSKRNDRGRGNRR
ncbi:hypothetical protein ACQ4LE_008560 [Meloidogyne hapla]